MSKHANNPHKPGRTAGRGRLKVRCKDGVVRSTTTYPFGSSWRKEKGRWVKVPQRALPGMIVNGVEL